MINLEPKTFVFFYIDFFDTQSIFTKHTTNYFVLHSISVVYILGVSHYLSKSNHYIFSITVYMYKKKNEETKKTFPSNYVPYG